MAAAVGGGGGRRWRPACKCKFDDIFFASRCFYFTRLINFLNLFPGGGSEKAGGAAGKVAGGVGGGNQLVSPLSLYFRSTHFLFLLTRLDKLLNLFPGGGSGKAGGNAVTAGGSGWRRRWRGGWRRRVGGGGQLVSPLFQFFHSTHLFLTRLFK
jgi:hypothetical protein